MPFNLLTPQQVADQLAIPKGQVRRLGLVAVRIGKGRGSLRYRQEDIDRYVRERIEDPRAQSAAPARRRQSGSNATGFRRISTWEELQQIRLRGQQSRKEAEERKESRVIRRKDGTILSWK